MKHSLWVKEHKKTEEQWKMICNVLYFDLYFILRELEKINIKTGLKIYNNHTSSENGIGIKIIKL